MQIVSSKAYYLRAHSLKSRARSQPRSHTTPTDSSKLTDIMRIRNLTSNRTQDPPSPLPRPVLAPLKTHNYSIKLQSIEERQHELLQRVCKWKLAEGGRRGRCASVTVQRHPIAQVNSLQFETMKPTNRYFQQVENIRLAERLLLAKPSPQIARTSQQKFYQQQEGYRLNIARLSSRHPSTNQRSLHRKKWVD